MTLHTTLITPGAHTPSYLLTCARTFHRTIIDATQPTSVAAAIGNQALDLILLTTATAATIRAAATLHGRTGAPILAHASLAAHLPLARGLDDQDVVAMGPLAQTMLLPGIEDDTPTLAFAVGSAGLLFTGGWFTKSAGKKRPTLLAALPEDTHVLGGHAPEATPSTAPTLLHLLGRTVISQAAHAPALR